MTLFSGLVLANVSLALLAAVMVWRAAINADDLRKALKRTMRLASTDTLTELPNRDTLRTKLAEALDAGGNDIALMFIDLDNFKVINDTLGHNTGDDLLKAVAERLTPCLGKGDVLARMGGDEFATVVTRKGAEVRAMEVAEAISNAMKDAFELSGDVINIKASIGISAASDTVRGVSELLRRADVAMYVAKTEDHATACIYQSTMDEALHLRRTISAELDAALSGGELELVYQPLVCARTGELTSAEALMRWPRKDGSAASPGVFIPIAEETGLITKLGEWALDQALMQIKALGNIPIAVNVSPVQFRGEGFATSVEAALKRHAVDPSLLRIEITEGVLISHTGEAQRTMKHLRDLGVQVLLDDFGTGYSSLRYLQQFEFDGLKIDRAFIQHLEDGRTGRQLLKSIIALGHSLNMKVIAEGVETDDQAALLQLLRCDVLQGYALGRPGDADALQELVALPALQVRARVRSGGERIN